MVLAAGYGTRLLPLTQSTPKPALPVGGAAVAARTLARLAAAGCEAAAINLHHRGERLRAVLGERLAGMPLVYSEEQEILGTLGALWPLREFWAPARALLVINGDSLCRWPLARLLRAHRRSGAAATLLFSRRADPAAFGGGVEIGAEGTVVDFGSAATAAGGGRRRVFAGAHLVETARLAGLEPRRADFVDDLYRPLVARGVRLTAVETWRRWHDLGTPERYRRAVLDWLFRGRPWRRRWVGEGARVGPGAVLRRSVVEAGASVGADVRLRDTLVLPGASVGRAARLRRCVVGFDARVPEGAEIEGQLVTPDGTAVTAGGSRVGELVFTPLG